MITTTIATTPPAWLPTKLHYDGDWDTFLKALYDVFTIDFKSGTLSFRGVPVKYNSRIDTVDNPHGYEEGFWHFVTRDEFVWNATKRCKEKQRLIDTDRAEYLPWGRSTIEHESAPEVMAWDFDQVTKKGTVVRTYLWLKSWDYTVILERQTLKMGDVFMLITTFLVDVPAKRLDLESRYNRRK